jgi:Ca2+-binding RTX toxin-like protein
MTFLSNSMQACKAPLPKPRLAKLKPLFEAASNDTAFSLESLVGALGRLFTGNGLIAQDNRESLYSLIHDIRASAGYQLAEQMSDVVRIVPFTSLSGGQIATLAQADTPEGLAYRYAVANLIPFAITGEPQIFASHNAHGQLDLYDPATGTGALTSQYLKDRAAMLSWKMKYDVGAEDADDDPLGILSRNDKPYAEDWDSWTINGDWDFIDHTAIVGGSPLKLTIDGVDLTTTANHQIVFGSNNADTLTGSELRDNLYGGGGNDTFTGNGGNDWLEGGAGFDTYVINAGDGYDTVLDSDGSGVIKFGSIEARGSTGIPSGKWHHTAGSSIWIDQHNGISYSTSTVSGETRLLISKGDNTVLVKGWSDGELGISLGNSAPPAVVVPVVDLTLSGDLQPLDTDPGTSGVQLGYDALGNVIVTAEAAPNREDILFDSIGNDKLIGLGGNDILYAWRGGNDQLEGGAGQDYLAGGAGDDTLVGGTDSDVLLGGTDNDTLYGGAQVADLAAAILAFETQTGSGMRGDWLSGAEGTDTLVGEAGDDVLLGGEGEDLLIGGGGNDNLYGDRNGNANISWSMTRSVTTQAGQATYFTAFTQGDAVEAMVGAADVIYGGAGEDWIYGGQGNDILLAGADNDVVYGEDGSDVILGQGGNDVLVGGSGTLAPQNDGADYIDGGDGDDILFGLDGDDVLFGLF